MAQSRTPIRLSVALIALSLAACSPAAAPSPVATPNLSSPVPVGTQPLAATTAPTSAPTAAALRLLPELPTGSLDATTGAALQQALFKLVQAGAPDALAAVITPNGQWQGAAGVDGPNAQKAAPGDEFFIASVTKLIQTTALFRLAEQGKVDLDKPLSDYLGDFATQVDSNGATVRQALGMQAGIGDTPAAIQLEPAKDCTHVWARKEVLVSIPAPHAAAGGGFEYSNPTFKLLGLATEHITGKFLGDVFDELAFQPSGASRIVYQGPNRSAPKPWALPIKGYEGNLKLSEYGAGGTMPCLAYSTFSFQNAVASDAQSLAQFGWQLFAGKIVTPDSLAAMTKLMPGGGLDRANGFLDIGYASLGHGDGYAAVMVVFPARQIVAVLFLNAGDADQLAAVKKLVDALPR